MSYLPMKIFYLTCYASLYVVNLLFEMLKFIQSSFMRNSKLLRATQAIPFLIVFCLKLMPLGVYSKFWLMLCYFDIEIYSYFIIKCEYDICKYMYIC